MTIGCAPVLAVAIAVGAVTVASPGGEPAEAPASASHPPVEPSKPVTQPAVHARRVTGSATWYRYRPGRGAAGPRLRKLLGPHWRGQWVTVRVPGHHIRVKLTDWCRCPNGRIIDLDSRSFAVLGSLRRGVITVTVSR